MSKGLLDKCDFNVKDFRYYLNFNNGKIDPEVNYEVLQKVDNQFFVCADCYHKNKQCHIVDILISGFGIKN